MTLKTIAGAPKKVIEEKITNRILINIAYSILGYFLLYMFYQYSIGRMGDILTYKYVMCGLFVVLALVTVALYILSFVKSPLEKYASTFRNYGHMSLAVTIAAFYVNLPFYTQWAPIEASSGIIRSVLMFLKNTRYAYYVVGIAIAGYLVGCIIYNTIIMKKLTNRKNAKKYS